MEKGIIETVDNFLDSLGTTGRVAVELAGGDHNAQTDYISQLQFQQGITANIGETIKDAFKSGAPYGEDFILPASAIRISRYKQGN